MTNMMKSLHKTPTFRNAINTRQVLFGLAALFVGSSVYLVDRPPDQTYFLYGSDTWISLYHVLPNLCGIFGGTLPAFIHIFAFILISAGIASSGRKGCLVVCVSWFFVDCAFELGQKYSALSLSITPDWFAGIPYLEACESFFREGTFDPLDVAAMALGALAAYFVLAMTMTREDMI